MDGLGLCWAQNSPGAARCSARKTRPQYGGLPSRRRCSASRGGARTCDTAIDPPWGSAPENLACKAEKLAFLEKSGLQHSPLSTGQCSTSLFAPPSRRKQLQVDVGLRRDIEQCLTASFVPRSARCRVHCRLLRALLLRAYCQPALVACSRCAAVGRASRRLAVGNARFLPHFLQNALLVASISLYKLTRQWTSTPFVLAVLYRPPSR